MAFGVAAPADDVMPGMSIAVVVLVPAAVGWVPPCRVAA
jgi:hypothetical protein